MQLHKLQHPLVVELTYSPISYMNQDRKIILRREIDKIVAVRH